jgi:hypothetical protein
MPESFVAALWLPGWEDFSIWGYDENIGGLLRPDVAQH